MYTEEEKTTAEEIPPNETPAVDPSETEAPAGEPTEEASHSAREAKRMAKEAARREKEAVRRQNAEKAEAERLARQERLKKHIIKTVCVFIMLAVALLFSAYAVFGELLFPEDEIYTATKGEALALADARACLSAAPLSEHALIDYLKSEGYAESEIRYALETCSVNFALQAERAALAYLSAGSYSAAALLEQLRVDGFTASESSIAVDGIMNPRAITALRELLRDGWASKQMVFDTLRAMGFGDGHITFALSVSTVDFSLQAERAAVSYLEYETLSRDALIAQLGIEGFTSVEAVHGADYALSLLP